MINASACEACFLMGLMDMDIEVVLSSILLVKHAF